MDSTNFESEVWKYYTKNKRHFPWRETTNPYRILVSEVMLQQTQTSRVLPYYERFIQVFPNVESLAQGQTTELLRVWKGLGYNRRALQLQRAAKLICAKHNGKIPMDFSALVSLPGIGPNTAGAILAYAFNQDVVFIETNIRKTIMYFFFAKKPKVTDKEILEILQQHRQTNPREWYWALVDYGSMLGKKKIIHNSQSKHYSKQPEFEGSHRQKRSIILQAILEHQQISTKELTNVTGLQELETVAIVSELEREGFLSVSEGKILVTP